MFKTSDFSNEAFDFAQGSVYGIRKWYVDPRDNHDHSLVGAYGGVWISGQNTASCGHYSCSPCPGIRCSCGIYAYWHRVHALCKGCYPYAVYGVIEGFGHTIIGDLGFRCEYARIVALYASPGYMSSMARRCELKQIYKVPVYDNAKVMLEFHPLTKEYTPPLEAEQMLYSSMRKL